jgi:hypothetical protein
MEYKLSIIILMDQIDTKIVETIQSINPFEILIVSKNKETTLSDQTYNCKLIIAEEGERNEGYIRALKESNGNVFLILDGGILYDSSQLTAFLQPIKEGWAQVVLNNLTPTFIKKRVKQWPDSYTLWRQVFNDALGHNQRIINSLLSTPHAFTKEVVETIGYEGFENLAVAHMRILEQGFKINDQLSIPTIFPGDFFTPQLSKFHVPLTKGERDHMGTFFEALWEWHRVHGLRGNYHDGGRRRDLIYKLKDGVPLSDFASIHVGSGTSSSIYNGKQLSVIIPAQNEENTIATVITEAKKLQPLEIIVVINGSTDKTEEIAKQLDVTVITIPDALGHDVGRSIGAFMAKGDILLFIDADFPIFSYHLSQFCRAVVNGVDVALNNLNLDYFPLYIVNLYKYLLNIACDRKELGVGSMVAVPHAISRSCLDGIGWDSLMNPNLAHVKAVLQGFRMENVHFVDVMKPNRIRPDQHFAANGHPKAVLRINGDHLEALIYMLQQIGYDREG